MTKANSIDVAISFDTTGSMYPCLTQVRRKVAELVRRLFKDIPGLRMAMISHGDYCDGSDVINILDFTDDEDKIVRFVETAPSTGGGDAPECYELGLLLEQGVHVYAMQALARSKATHFYKEVAEKTEGLHLELHQFNAINDLLMAICYKQDGEEALKKYEAEVEKRGAMTPIVGANFDRMFGREVRPVPKAAGYSGGGTYSYTPRRTSTSSVVASGDIDESKLEPVHPSRFQVLDIDGDCAIKAFVNDNGLEFRTGRGFYEFKKTVKVQNYKEVVLVNNVSGSMFSGAQARQMLGLPKAGEGGTVSLRYGVLKGYTAFIQSTSHNRKLLAGTKFLYEVHDWDREAEAA